MIKTKTNFVNCQLKNVNFFFILLTFSIFHQPFSIAEIHYVSHSGNNIPPYLTWEDAADSIQAAINVCSHGDTVIVANGIYYENLVIDSALILIGSSMDSTVIDGTGLDNITITVDADFIVENFNIYGKGNGVGGAVIYSENILQIKNCQISEGALGVGCLDVITADNIFMKNLNIGFSFASSYTINYHITNCVIILKNRDARGITIGFASEVNAYISNNILLYTETAPQYLPSEGISFGAIKKAYIKNNLISGFNPNIYIDEVLDTVFIINNIIAYGKSSGLPGGIGVGGEITEINNTIVSNNAGGIDGDFFVTSDYNLFWNNGTDLYGLSYGDSDRAADPMFIKDTLPNSLLDFDYHLQAFSPGIDKGNPNILDMDSTRSDIGMFGGPLGEKYTYMDLAPKPPANLTALYENKVILLKWNRNTEADLSHYRIYRDTVSNFIYDISKMIGETTDTMFSNVLPESNLEKNYYYKITAYDNQENQSAASEEVHIVVTGLGEIPPQVVEEYKLMNNYPNPFNPSTTIPYRLKEAGYVKVMVYNILGELVRVLVNQWQDKGYYEVDFKPDETERKRGEEGFPGMHTWYHSNYVSGVYLLRIEVIGERNIPRFSDMRKMMLVK